MSKQVKKKTNYFYIDESGGILNNSPVFILGCTRTDTPRLIENSVSKLLADFEDEIYFSPMIEDIRRQGFHAVENHFDVRAAFFRLLPVLNFRAFFCILNKQKPPILELVNKGEETKVYLLALNKLLRGRLNNRQDNNVFIFEELQFQKGSQQQVLDNFFPPYVKEGHVIYQIVGKENLNLATTDYMNYIFYSILTAKKLKDVQRMVDNLELAKPKIAVLHMYHTGTFLTRRDSYDAAKIVDLYNGQSAG
jgi:hypothetical protein